MSKVTYVARQIAEVLDAETALFDPEAKIQYLATDSRSLTDPARSLFFALEALRDGHEFAADAYQRGVRNFVFRARTHANKFAGANIFYVDDVRAALQKLAAFHRRSFNLETIAITGSNGKTIVKEWLYQLLVEDFNIVRSPKSFNSQIGVPLSVWQITPENDLAIFEAGVSKANEMTALANVVRPTIGVLTNIGDAHSEGFADNKEKLAEKLKLFKGVKCLIASPDYLQSPLPDDLAIENIFTWSMTRPADLRIMFSEPIEGRTYLRALYQEKEIECLLPFVDHGSVENGIICWATLLSMGYTPEVCDARLEKLSPIGMRLELKNGINQCSVIDDSYSADVSSLAIALDFMNLQNQHPRRTLILSDIPQSGKNDAELYVEVAALLHNKNVNRLIGIGPQISAFAEFFSMETAFFDSTEAFLEAFPGMHFSEETILVKGARRFGFERISKVLTQKVHDTVLEINLNALSANLQFYRSQLDSGTKIMAMVKAFSYGSGTFEIANLLQFNKADYLAVAYTDEGVALRKGGIKMPIMVMSPEFAAFEAIVQHRLEPELYSLEVLNNFLLFLGNRHKDYPVHLKLDTGMHRLGFDEKDINELKDILSKTDAIKVTSIFSHLVASDAAEHDGFSIKQIEAFNRISLDVLSVLDYMPLRHICNTSAIVRWPDAHFDMVRIGIGLYGFDAALAAGALQTVAVLKTTVTQVKTLQPGESVGYSRAGMMPDGGQIATVKIGYADGYSRAFGNGVGKMLVAGQLVPVVGSVCMDMCMLDVTGLKVSAGDTAIVFNDQHSISALAASIGTIPYEILTNISQRVKRVYFYE
ncbi:bifunctional UDP-N-acetylmuramoyl-tripeptide:D-alanyl-D-alanine ligase/alanine racemase [Pedobacter sp. SYP-B3415]|uniref:bifunctional UDP-N-acetylmuramoyl-tripeptide:D-alanyl-D-alanine ligase/alanine racemase n=1 Tax=Pedobacter sp. SYP-B3415 TaxID=2496641 RepID=UPI00101D19D2|nr:bifunctional UDP-N-acetylmuramoyl-tripeptide:D-alanyl-D-alanine ligase/alanine racemase [Pedobacter sp. SYP-B3415]